MLQRVVIGMALAAEPSLLILDEPTTALDATVEAEVLDLIANLRADFNTSLLFISHTSRPCPGCATASAVLYAGELMEQGPGRAGAAQSAPSLHRGAAACDPAPRLAQRRPPRAALDDSRFAAEPGSVTAGCVFAARCALAADRCRSEHPPLYAVSDVHTSRCHLHERAQELPVTAPVVHDTAVAAAAARQRDATPVLSVRSASKTFRMGGHHVHALRGVDLDIAAGGDRRPGRRVG